MKATVIPLLLAAASGGTQASTFTGGAAAPALWSSGPAAWMPIMEAANRTGSRRVGGRSGKGGHYVGGRRK
jgi:hypothetical protein